MSDVAVITCGVLTQQLGAARLRRAMERNAANGDLQYTVGVDDSMQSNSDTDDDSFLA